MKCFKQLKQPYLVIILLGFITISDSFTLQHVRCYVVKMAILISSALRCSLTLERMGRVKFKGQMHG